MEYIIRPIEQKDNPVVESIIRSCLLEFGGNREGTAWCDPDLGRFSEVYAAERSAYWVAENKKGNVVGGVGIGPIKGVLDVCELQKMYCLPEDRGSGIAGELLSTALTFAAAFYRKCYLETLENMVQARSFYEKHGFTRTWTPVGSTGHFSCDVMYIRNLDSNA